ncbi:MAG: helix-turn-helix domain-containing protein [Bacilli bacterium]|nr:helix-turn-helix domain-containing protein [Bacilli bacterium]
MKNNIFSIERKRLGLTQEQLAKKLNTSRSNVANWENGQNKPSVELLFKCSSLFECDVMYLAGYQKERIQKDDNIPEPKEINDLEFDKIKELILFENVLKRKGFLDENEKLSEENYNRLIDFAKANKQFIMKDNEK